MKLRVIILVAGLALPAGLLRAADQPALKTEKDKVSYGLGMSYAGWLKNNQIDLDVDLFVKALRDELSSNQTMLTPAEMQETLRRYQQQIQAKMLAKRREDEAKNKTAGEAFLAANKSKPGVQTLPSGLQYKVLKDGSGPSPKATDEVTVNYRGTFVDGTEFDSSAKQGHPVTFKLGQVIRGWIEGIQKMKVGSKWQLYIPSNLAYGTRGYGRLIGPNSTLIFEVELLGIKEPTQAAVPMPPQPVTSDIIKVPSAEEMKKGAKIEIIKPGQTNAVTNPTK
ncbi:MAG: FKBP-type peptidyl-prolyl cis-trans isomerase [Verrucomicrobia bacterium]|nr:FKBP-type peptidyl-prolyl cis-trans isomerase [Verrucomicrobiota bacterium]